MNPFKKAAGHLFMVYAVLVFLLTMLPVYLLVLAIRSKPDPQRTKALHSIFRVWMGVYMPLVFCPVRRRGKEHFQPGQQYVVVCNHNSFVDVPVSSPWIPGPNKTLAKIEIARVPLFGLIYKTGSILVDRKSDTSRKDSFRQMRETLQMGLHLCLYPEGTRNKSTEPLQPFQDGAFVIAIREQQPIMPALIFNTGKVLPHDQKFWAWPYRIRFDFLPPIATKGLSLQDLPALKEQVWQQMKTYYTAHQTS
jgi:1-acyl-sn-glycerol-3-phosphate acyltransferase